MVSPRGKIEGTGERVTNFLPLFLVGVLGFVLFCFRGLFVCLVWVALVLVEGRGFGVFTPSVSVT